MKTVTFLNLGQADELCRHVFGRSALKSSIGIIYILAENRAGTCPPRPEPRFLHVAAGLNAPRKPPLKRSAQVPRFRYLDATVHVYIVVPNKDTGLPPPTPPGGFINHVLALGQE